MQQTRPTLSGRPVALFVFSNLREQKGGLTKAWLRRLAIFHGAGWDTHVATIHPQPEIDETLAAWRDRGWLEPGTQVHHYQRRSRSFRPAWVRKTHGTWTRDDRIADWLDWLVGLVPGVVVFADSPVTYAPVAKMRNPYVGRVMTVHLAHRGSDPGRKAAAPPARSIYQGPAGTPKLSGRFLPYAAAADLVVAPTRRQAEHLAEDVPGLDVRVIPNIVDRPVIDAAPERDPMLVVQLGRLDPFKRVDHAIRAVAAARAALPGLRLAIYGRGPDQQRLEDLRDELGLHDVVAFEGFTDEPLRVLAGAAASLMTSRREGFGLAVAESLSVGTPVVTYDIDYGPAELVTDHVNGRVVRNGSVADLAEAIVEVVGDRAAWQRMSAAGPAAIDRLQTDEVGTAWIGLAEEVAGRVALPQRALLVEDLSVDPDGLRVRGVVLGRNPVPAPVTIGTEDRAARTQLSPTSAVGDTDVVSEVAGELPWGEVRRWPVGAALVGVDAQGEPVPIIAPGVPAIAATDRHGVVVLQRDVAGILRRVAVDQPPVLRVDPARARVLVGEDETWVSEVLAIRGRLVGQGAGDEVELDVGLPGVQLDEESSIPVVARVDADRVRIGLLQPQPAAGQWREGLWTTPALVRWDEGALLDLARRELPPVPISLGLGGRLRNVGPVDFDGRRPIMLASAEGWLLAPSESGRALLVRGAGLAARTLWHARSLRRAGWTRGRSEDRDPR